MAEFIEKDKVLSIVEEYKYGSAPKNYGTLLDILRELRELQPAEVTARIRGKWEPDEDGNWHCSHCGAVVEKFEQNDHNWYFCYHCGAKMTIPKEDSV